MAKKTPLQNIFWSLQWSGGNYQTTTPDNYLDNPNNPNNQVENWLQNTNTTTVTNPLSGLAGIGNWGGRIKAPVTTPKPWIQPNAVLPSQQTSNNSIFNPDQYLQQQLWALWNQQSLAQEDIIKAYQKVSWQLWFQKAQQNSQYENLDLINEKVSAVTKQFEQGINDPLLISRNTWLTPEEVNKVIRGDIYKDLKLNERTAFEANKPFQQKLSDFELQKQRNLEDINTKTERAKMLLTQHLDDITREMTESTSALGKMWALSQQWLSSGFQMWIENIKDNANRVMDTLKQTADRENADTLKVKDRMLEDYTTNVTRIKDVAESEFNKIKLQWLAAIQEIDQKWWLSSENAYNALRKLYADTDSAKWQLYKDQFAMYQDLNAMTLNRAKAIWDIFWQSAAQDFLSQQGMYQPTPQKSLVWQRAEENWFYTPWQITTEGKTFGGMWWFDIAGALNDPILAQKWGKIIRFGTDTPVTMNWKTYPANRYIEIQGEDWNIIRYNHLNGIWDWTMSRWQDMVWKTVQAGQQIGLMGRSWVTSYDPKKWGNSWVHLDITAYPPERAWSKAVKAYQSMDDQRRILLWQWWQQPQTSENKIPSYYQPLFRSYVENEKLPTNSQLEKMWLTIDQFTSMAEEWYTSLKQDEYAMKWFEISNPTSFINISPAKRDKLDTSIEQVWTFDSQLDDVINKVEQGGVEIQWYFGRGRELTQDINNLALLAKEIYNLWVLNWEDLRLMQNILPNPADFSATIQWKDAIITQLKNAKKKFNNTINGKAMQYGIKRIDPSSNHGNSQSGWSQQALQLFLQYMSK